MTLIEAWLLFVAANVLMSFGFFPRKELRHNLTVDAIVSIATLLALVIWAYTHGA